MQPVHRQGRKSAERPYGAEAIFEDVSGDWFGVTQRCG